MLINPNPRQMSLVQPVVALFYSIFKKNGIDMRFFDTTFYDVSAKYNDPDLYTQNIRDVKLVKEDNTAAIGYEPPTKRFSDIYADFRSEVESYKPDVLMISALESTIVFARDLLRAVRDLGVPHVLGGVFATYAPELALSYDEIDIVSVGEAEDVIVPLVKKIVAGELLDDLPGVWT